MVRILLSTRLGERKWTQADLSRMTGIRPNTISELYHEGLMRPTGNQRVNSFALARTFRRPGFSFVPRVPLFLRAYRVTRIRRSAGVFFCLIQIFLYTLRYKRDKKREALDFTILQASLSCATRERQQRQPRPGFVAVVALVPERFRDKAAGFSTGRVLPPGVQKNSIERTKCLLTNSIYRVIL